MDRPDNRIAPARTTTFIGGRQKRKAGTRSGAYTFSANLRGLGGLSGFAASASATYSVSATLAGVAVMQGSAGLSSPPVGQTHAIAATLAGVGAQTASVILVPPDTGAPATFTDVASATIQGYPFTIYGNTTVDAAFADSSTDQGPQGALTAVTSSGLTIVTKFGWQTVIMEVGQDATNVDFGDPVPHRIELADHRGGEFHTFTNCRIVEGEWAGNPTVYGKNHHSGGTGPTANWAGNAYWNFCEFTGDGTAPGVLFVYNFGGIHHFKGCNVHTANSDTFRVGGGTVQYHWYSNMGHDPGGHYDCGECNHTVSEMQWYRVTAKMAMQVPHDPGDGVASVWKNGPDGYAGAVLSHDRDMEECLIQSVTNEPQGMQFMHAFINGGTADTGRINYKDNYGLDFVQTSGSIFRNSSNTNNPNWVCQNSQRLDTNTTFNWQTFTAPGGAPVLAVTSAAAGEITLTWAQNVTNATGYQVRFRERGSRFWEIRTNKLWWIASSPHTITGLDVTKYYEAQARAINDAGPAGNRRMKGSWSNLAFAKADGGAGGGGGTPTVGLVTNLINTAATSNSLSFSFTAAPNADSHQRQFSINNGLTWTGSQAIDSPFTTSSLNSSTAYLFRVRGVSTTLGNGAWTTIQATTTGDTAGGAIALQSIGAVYAFTGNGGSDAQTASVAVPAVETGDLMVLVVGCRQVATVTPPVDWTSEGLANVVTNTGSVQIFSKVAAGNAAATTIDVGFVDGRSNNTTHMCVLTFRGGTGDIEGFAEKGKFVTAGQSTCAGIAVTTTDVDRIAVNVWRTSNAAIGSTANSAGPPTGWTEQVEASASSGYNDMLVIDTIAVPTAGTVAAATLTPTNAVQNYIMAAFAVF